MTESTLQLVLPRPEDLRVANGTGCTEQSRCSEVIYINGLPWKMYAHIDHKSMLDSSRWLNVFLVCCWEIEASWIINISTVVRAVKDGSKREKRVDFSLRDTSPTVTFERFMRWQEMFLSHFTDASDKLILEIDVKIISIDTLIRNPYDLRGPSSQSTDFQVVLNGTTTLHANSKMLAIRSKYFKKMVQKGRNELIIDNDGVEHQDLEAFLQLIHGNTSVINGRNLFNLLQLSQLLESTTAEQLCAQFFLRSKHLDMAEKILIAKKFHLKSVKKVLIRSISHREHFDKIFAETKFDDPRQKISLIRHLEERISKRDIWNRKAMGDRSVREVIECELDCSSLEKELRSRYKTLMVDGIPFLFGLELHTFENTSFCFERYFRIHLECLLDKNIDWYLDLTTVIQLKCHGDNGVSELAKTTRTFTQFQPRVEELIQNVEPSDKTRLLLIGEFALRKVKFSVFPDKFKYWRAPGTFTDGALKVGGAKFYVVKEVLASESPYFHVLFYHSFIEKEQQKITLEGIDPFEFEELLLCVYYPQRPITPATVEFLLELADYLDFQSILTRCDWYLRSSKEFDGWHKQHLALQYRLENTLLLCDVDLQYLTLHCGISDSAQTMITRIMEAKLKARALQLH